MTVCGTGMSGPEVAIGVEELARMGGDTFIRVGSCGVFQEGQRPVDVIAASGTVRVGGTGNAYLPPIFPAVPTFSVLRSLVEAGEELNIPVMLGVGIAGNNFYASHDARPSFPMKESELVSIKMESDTLFIVGAVLCAAGGRAPSSHRMAHRRNQARLGRSRCPPWRDGRDQYRIASHVEDCRVSSGKINS